MNQEERTLSGISADILQNSRRNGVSPIIARVPNAMTSCWVTFPGCDFEVLICNEVAVGFRRADVYVVRPYVPLTLEMPIDVDWQTIDDKEEFHARLLDNLMIALRGVTGKGDIVADSRHFVAVMAKAIERLDALSKDIGERQVPGTDPIREEVDNIKLAIFRHLMSKDLRK